MGDPAPLAAAIVSVILIVAGITHLFVRPDQSPTNITFLGTTFRLPSTSLALVAAGSVVLLVAMWTSTHKAVSTARSIQTPTTEPVQAESRIDSGYSHTMVFRKGDLRGRPNFLMFHAANNV